METIETDCVIAGGGPAGLMLAYILAKNGVKVIVLEKWPDFFRDFRGDTIHPSTLDNLAELGLIEKFLALPHDETHELTGRVGEHEMTLASFKGMRLRYPFIAFIPQWDFLNFISKEASEFPEFSIRMQTQATDLLRENGKVVGVKARGPEGECEIRAKLTVGADGRHSTIFEKSGLVKKDIGAPIDVLWFRLPRSESDSKNSFGNIQAGRFMAFINRQTYWQCAYVIRKGGFEMLKSRGLDAFNEDVCGMAMDILHQSPEIKNWDEVKLLQVAVDRLEKWYDHGLLILGDAAHAMSPIGGLGINVAIQDSIAAGNILVPAFRRGRPVLADLAQFQKRREWVVKMTQWFQVKLQNNLIDPIVQGTLTPKLWLPLRLLRMFPRLSHIPARIIGLGIRPEHVDESLRFVATN